MLKVFMLYVTFDACVACKNRHNTFLHLDLVLSLYNSQSAKNGISCGESWRFGADHAVRRDNVGLVLIPALIIFEHLYSMT